MKHLHFAEPKIVGLLSVVPDVNKLAVMPQAVVAQKDGLLSLKLAFELGARFVHGFVAFE